MKRLLQINLSLHSKLLIITWLMVIYLLLLLCGIGSFIAVVYIKSDFDEQNKAVIYKSQLVLNMKSLVPTTIDITDSYPVSSDMDAQDDFNALNKEFNIAYAGIYALTGSKEERSELESAFEEWNQVKRIRTAILDLQKSQQDIVDTEIAQQYVTLNGHLLKLENTLDRLYDLVLDYSNNITEHVRELDARTIPIILLLFITSLGINTIAIILIIRSVIIPTHVLAQAAHNFAQGSLSYRIPLDAKNEIGELAHTFNDMAEKLESSYTSLKEMAIHDGLTGILNHQEFHKRLLSEVKRAARYKRTLSLIMLDIDLFKKFNDTYGHQAGDSVLKAMGWYLKSAIRSSDMAARYGGEEFALIMPETPAETAFITAQRIGAEIARLPISVDKDMQIHITMSIGVATFPQDGAIKEELISAADRSLYKAKQSGRNRVCKSSD